MIRVVDFSILTLVKSCCFFIIFFLKDYLGLMTQVINPSTLDLLFIRLSSSRGPGCEFTRLT
jgi:hypothetical protein